MSHTMSENQINNKSIYNFSCDKISKIVSKAEIKVLYEQIFCDEAENIDYSLQPFCDEKLGFLGSHLKLELIGRTKKSQQIRKKSFFLKIIPYQLPLQAIFIQESQIFAKEIFFFENIVPELNYNYFGEKWSPICYLIKDDALVFENLKEKGFRMIPDKIFDRELMIAALTSIANLHAASIIAEDRLKQKFNIIFPEAFEENPFDNSVKRLQWFETAVDFTIFLADKLGLKTENIFRACRKSCEGFKPSATKRNVVSHGDLWGNNLLFNETKKKCVLVDFQLLRYSSLAHDVTQLLYLCTTRDFREKHEAELIKHYFAVLTRALMENNKNIQIPSWSELLDGIEEQRLCAIVTAAIFFPTVLMDGKSGAEIFDDPENYDKYVFHDRKDFVFSIMQRDPHYARRINEIVEELVEFAEKLQHLPNPS
ncbi:uncharacterized protein LOC122511642 [Leptopilina heterotoma]|uniref:uncharacterized protein LOC122511642 n=1 Tax=Leptopilina heterotoma TaxID=63436 RepID=UPI001CA85C72|nr:uncharacterized protein LOC122511642 [Leptopilina heterotoma]